MYAVGNFEKFLTEKGITGKQAEAIMARVQMHSQQGCVRNDLVATILDDAQLEHEFRLVTRIDPQHRQLALEASVKFQV